MGRTAIWNLSYTYACDYPEVESLVALKKAGYTVTEIPVRMAPRTEGRSSINLLKGLYYVLKVVLAVLVDALAEPRWKKEVGVTLGGKRPGSAAFDGGIG